MQTVEILKDSINSRNERATSWKLTYWRAILAEINTIRAFSRSTSSSRAIPFKKLVEQVKNNPALPSYWGKNVAGMQAKEELTGADKEDALYLWHDARDKVIKAAELLNLLGLHKQTINRLLEPWGHVTTILTFTDTPNGVSEAENFFALRAHPDAQPEFRYLAEEMLRQYNASTPESLEDGEWHIPFSEHMPEGATLEQKLKIATARCARISYLNHDGKIEPEKDYDLHNKLYTSGHFSAFEHCAFSSPGIRSGNFQGWTQYRKTLPNECRNDPRVIKKVWAPKNKTWTGAEL